MRGFCTTINHIAIFYVCRQTPTAVFRNKVWKLSKNPSQTSIWNISGESLTYIFIFVQYHVVIDCINTVRPRQNSRRFADDTFKRIFLNENVRFSIKISLKFVPKGPINNNPALVQIMAWRQSGDKTLSERHYLNQWWLVYWRIYASLGLSELEGNLHYRFLRVLIVWFHMVLLFVFYKT